MIAAVIGIGSNSIRMLTADIRGSKARQVWRDREGTRLFAGLDEAGRLQPEAMRHSADTVARLAAVAVAKGAEKVWLFATSAARDAVNAAELADLLRAETGLTLEICAGEEEARLSFLGAADGGFTGVIDIGGGSTEVVTGTGADLASAVSCQMGAVRLFRTLPLRSSADLPAVAGRAREILRADLAASPIPALPPKWIGTGGTFTTLAAMKLRMDWSQRTRLHGVKLSRQEVEDRGASLADMPLSERLKLPGLQPKRADIIVHGIAILLGVMAELGIPEISVSEYGNLDGYLKRKYGIEGTIC